MDHSLHNSFEKTSDSTYDAIYIKEFEKDSDLHFAYAENENNMFFGFYDIKEKVFVDRYVVISKKFGNMLIWSKKPDGKWMCLFFRGRDRSTHYLTTGENTSGYYGYYLISEPHTKGSAEISQTLKNINRESRFLFIEDDKKDGDYDFTHLYVHITKNGKFVDNPYMKTMANYWCKISEDKNGNEVYNQIGVDYDVLSYETVWVPYAEPEFIDMDYGWRWDIDTFSRGPHQNFIADSGLIYYEDYMHDWDPLTPKDRKSGHDVLIKAPNGVRFYMVAGPGGYMTIYDKNKTYAYIASSNNSDVKHKGWVIASKYIYGGAIDEKTLFYDRGYLYKNIGLYYSTDRIEILRIQFGEPLAGVIIEDGLKLFNYINTKKRKSSNYFWDD